MTSDGKQIDVFKCVEVSRSITSILKDKDKITPQISNSKVDIFVTYLHYFLCRAFSTFLFCTPNNWQSRQFVPNRQSFDDTNYRDSTVNRLLHIICKIIKQAGYMQFRMEIKRSMHRFPILKYCVGYPIKDLGVFPRQISKSGSGLPQAIKPLTIRQGAHRTSKV